LKNLTLELVQKGTLQGTGKLLSENAKRFNYYDPLVQAGYTELLVYSTSGPAIMLDPKKRLLGHESPIPTPIPANPEPKKPIRSTKIGTQQAL